MNPLNKSNALGRRFLLALACAAITILLLTAARDTVRPATADPGNGHAGEHGNVQHRAKGRPFVSPSEPE